MTDAPQLSRLGRAALAYAALGWPVFTLQPRSKKPLMLCDAGEGDDVCLARLPAKDKKTGEYTCKKCGTIHTGKKGLYEATTDPAIITRWWMAEPKANIGIRCGHGLLFLDVDVPEPGEGKTADGEATLALFEAENEELPATPRQQTGEKKQEDGSFRRGRQYAFRVEGEIRNSASGIGPGLDIRGDGGYVVAPPSIHPSGVAYAWDDGFKPSQVPLADAPQWLLDKIRESKELKEVKTTRTEPAPAAPVEDIGNKWVRRAVDGEYENVAKAGPGTRNTTLNRAAFKLGQLIGGNVLDETTARNALTAAAEANGYAGEEGAAHVEAVIASGFEAGMKIPRDIPERPMHQGPQTRAEMRVIVDNTKPEPEKKKASKKKDKDDEPEGKPVPKSGWMIENWEDHVELKPDSMILQPKVVRNAIALLMFRAEFADLFTFNKRNQTVMITRQPPWTVNGHPYPRPMTDSDVTGFQSSAEKIGLRLTASGYHDAINFAARERDFDPVMDKLKSLEWDGKPRLEHWLIDYMGAANNEFVKQAGAKWMIAAAMRVLRPGSKFDNMLVLEGPQGVMKSSALRVIAEALSPDCFSDRLSPLTGKDSMIELLGKVIVEIAELAAFKGADAEHIKRFLSAQDDSIRLPWDRTATRLLRGCVFAGTINPDGLGWMDDPTGGRRFWPIEVVEVDIEGLRRDAPLLWAEAKARAEKGESVWIEDEEVLELASVEVLQRTPDDAWATTIDEYIADLDRVTTDLILFELGVEKNKQTINETKRIAKHMTKRGWKITFPKIMKKGKLQTVREWRRRASARTLFSEQEGK